MNQEPAEKKNKRKSNKVYRKRNRISIQSQTAGMIVVAAIVPIMIIIIAFFSRFSDLITADTISKEQSEAATIAPLISAKIGQVESYMDKITETDYFRDVFEDPAYIPFSTSATEEERDAFKMTLQSIQGGGIAENIRIYTELPASSGIFKEFPNDNIFLPVTKISANYWYGIMANQTSSDLYAAENYLGGSERNLYGNCAYIHRVNTIYQGTAYSTYVVIYHDAYVYSSILTDWEEIEGSVSYILTDHDSVVASTDEGLSGIYRVSYEGIQESLLSSNSFVEKEVAGRTVYAAYYYIPETEWMMVTILPKEPILDRAGNQMFSFLAICCGIIIVVVLVALWASGRLSSRIVKVSKEMQNVQEGTLTPIRPSRANDEVSDLIDSYNYMVKEIDQLMEEQKKSAEELRKAEYNSLQAQINPHFLYNTMDMINWMTLQGKNEEASEVIQTLARFYKLTLSRKKDYSTIEDELEHAEIYVHLMNMRYEDIIEFVTDVPDELTQYRIPKLTFQPILENAILHGLLEKEERGGTIVLTAWDEDDVINILISDDGVGVKPEVLPKILSDKRPTGSKGGNIAVYNIHNRLKLLYGEEYGLSYHSVYGEGCEVTIRIPKHLGEDAYVKTDEKS